VTVLVTREAGPIRVRVRVRVRVRASLNHGSISSNTEHAHLRPKISRFQDFKISRFQDFKISRFHDFKISRFQDFKISRFQDDGACIPHGNGRRRHSGR